MDKLCICCQQVKPTSEFTLKLKRPSGHLKFRARCKVCYNIDQSEKRKTFKVLYPHLVKHRKYSSPESKAATLALIQDKRRRNILWLVNYKKSLSCADCGLSFKEIPWLCDFHHLDPATKSFEISKVNMTLLSIKELVMSEVVKCVPLCANCHRTRHYLERHPPSSVYVLNDDPVHLNLP